MRAELSSKTQHAYVIWLSEKSCGKQSLNALIVVFKS